MELIGRELAGISAQLNAHPEILGPVADELGSGATIDRCGRSTESVLRCALPKQYRPLTYDELAFNLLASTSFGAFARLLVNWTPCKAALQANIAAIRDATLEAINAQLLGIKACISYLIELGRLIIAGSILARIVNLIGDKTRLIDSCVQRGMGVAVDPERNFPGSINCSRGE